MIVVVAYLLPARPLLVALALLIGTVLGGSQARKRGTSWFGTATGEP